MFVIIPFPDVIFPIFNGQRRWDELIFHKIKIFVNEIVNLNLLYFHLSEFRHNLIPSIFLNT